MKLTTKGHYAVTAMLDMVLHDSGQPIKLESLAQRQGLSISYLERLAGKMRLKGLLKSVRGPGGGYRLARLPSEITVADIIDAVEEQIDATRCHGKGNCHKGATCLTHHLWDELNQQVMQFLNTMTLSRLAGLPAVQSIYSLRVEHTARNKDVLKTDLL